MKHFQYSFAYETWRATNEFVLNWHCQTCSAWWEISPTSQQLQDQQLHQEVDIVYEVSLHHVQRSWTKLGDIRNVKLSGAKTFESPMKATKAMKV